MFTRKSSGGLHPRRNEIHLKLLIQMTRITNCSCRRAAFTPASAFGQAEEKG